MKKQIGCWFVGCILAAVLAFTALPVFGEGTAEEETVYTCGDYTYVLQEDGTAMITHYQNVSKEHSVQIGGNRFSVDANGNRAVLRLPERLDGHLVTGIASGSFDDMEFHLFEADVFIPNTMMNIEPYAFGDGSVNRYLISPDHPKYMVSGDMLYEKETMRLVDWTGPVDNSELSITLIIPEGTRIIGECALAHAYVSEVVLPQSLECIEDEAFCQARNLKKINIPDNVTRIGEAAFYECLCLEEVTLPQGLEELGNNAFHSCRELQRISIPGSLNKIGAGTFAYCLSLEQVDMPSAVEAYRNGKLLSWQQLQNIKGVEMIGNGAFAFCERLEKIVLPDTVRMVGGQAFSGCSALKEIHLPEGLVSMGSGALSGCNSLTEITLPNSLTEVDVASFYASSYPFLTDCESLEQIIVSPDHPVFREENGALIRRSDCTLIAYPRAARAEEFTVPAGVTAIGSYAFYGNRYLKKITVSEGVACIWEKAFYKCFGLQELILPLSLESNLVNRVMTGDTQRTTPYAIDDCPMLEAIYITPGLTGETFQENEDKVMLLMEEAGDAFLLENPQGAGINVPLVMRKEQFDAYTDKMSKKNKKKVSGHYTLYTPEKLQKMTYEEQMEFLDIFPYAATEQLYILKYDQIRDDRKENLHAIFTEAGYTKEEFERDLQYVNPQYLQYKTFGTVEKRCEYSFADGMIRPCAYLSNIETIAFIRSQNSSVLMRYDGLPAMRMYFRE